MMPYFSFQWHITEDCDQRCKHCYIFSVEDRTALDSTRFDRMTVILENCLSMCRDLGRTPYFYITGGDPILNPDFWRLAEELRDRSVEFAVMGNPHHLTDEVCSRLKACGCEKYQVSIDGLRGTHDEIRRPGSFDETLDAVHRLRDAGIRCAVMTTVSRANASEMPGIMDTVVENGVDVFAFARYCPSGNDFGGEPLPPRSTGESWRPAGPSSGSMRVAARSSI